MKPLAYAFGLVLFATIGGRLPDAAAAERALPQLAVTFADPAWTGRAIPAGQHCQEQGGSGRTPGLAVRGIPAAAREIVVEFYDDTYGARQGRLWSHGKLGFRHDGAEERAIPSVAAYETAVPDGRVVANSDRGRPGYHPPCSGATGHVYSAVIKAIDAAQVVLAETRIVIGRY